MLLLISALGAATASAPPRHAQPVGASIETTLGTGDGQIRQFAFDGDESTFFASKQSPGPEDHFTLVLDQPVNLKSIAVTTGRANGAEKIEAGALQVSRDGKTFRELARFREGSARGGPVDEPIRAIRIRPGSATGSITIRELTIASEPTVPVFRYPVEITVDTTDAPDLKQWAERAARTCERAYPMINAELDGDGFRPPHQIALSVSSRYRGVAATSRDRIVASADYFRRHPGDVGALVHETVHVVQSYPGGKSPFWLVEGVSDYVRFFWFEPGKLGRINPETAHYNESYRVTAAFLAYLVEKYDKNIVRTLNRAMRAGRYEEGIFQQSTGKTVRELDSEWRATLRH